MIEEAEVREKLAAIATNELRLEEFEDWLESNSWSMHADSSAEATELVSSIHLFTSEYDHGDLSESLLRDELLSLLCNVVVSLHIAPDLRVSIAPRRRFGANSWRLPVPDSVVVPVPA